jgi:hypothetical protein
MSDRRPDAHAPALPSTGNNEQMGSTFFGDAVVANAAGPAKPQRIDTDRGIDGRVSGYA